MTPETKMYRNMKPFKKLYRVTMGIVEPDGSDFPTGGTVTNVVAVNAQGAMKRVRLKKEEYVSTVEIIARIDKV